MNARIVFDEKRCANCHLCSIIEACGVCVFPYMLMEEGTEIMAEFYSAVVGVEYSENIFFRRLPLPP